MSETQERAGKTAPVVFRVHRVSQLAVLTVAVCASPIAFASPWLVPIYLLPVLLGVWIERTRTTVDGDRVIARRMWHQTRFAWDDVRSFKLAESHWLRAVLKSGEKVTLPAVRVRDLPQLAELSGGRLPDPTVRQDDDDPGV